MSYREFYICDKRSLTTYLYSLYFPSYFSPNYRPTHLSTYSPTYIHTYYSPYYVHSYLYIYVSYLSSYLLVSYLSSYLLINLPASITTYSLMYLFAHQYTINISVHQMKPYTKKRLLYSYDICTLKIFLTYSDRLYSSESRKK